MPTHPYTKLVDTESLNSDEIFDRSEWGFLAAFQKENLTKCPEKDNEI